MLVTPGQICHDDSARDREEMGYARRRKFDHNNTMRKEREGMDTPRHQITMTVLMTPNMANFSGKVHGGTLLKYLDEVAYACASRWAGHYVVTLSVDQVMFRQPIHVGELVTFLGSVNYTGRSSMEIGIKVIAEDIRAGVVRHTNSCYFTMVAVGDDGKSIEVPQFEPTTDVERQRFESGLRRRELRREMEQRFHEIRHRESTE